MREIYFGLVAILVLASDVTAAGAPGFEQGGRLRSVQGMGRKLIEHGMKRSATFRELVENLERSDVIAYVDVRLDMGSDRHGSTQFVARSASDRFVRILINGRIDWLTQVAVLGHELQHANEIAGAKEIGSTEDLRPYYERVGIRVSGNAYDTEAAVLSGRMVRSEIRGASKPLVTGRRVSLEEVLSGGKSD